MPSPESQPAPQYGSRLPGAATPRQAAADPLPGLRIRTLAPHSAEGRPTHPKATGQRAAGCGFHLTFCTTCKMGTKPARRHCSGFIKRPPPSRWNSHFFLKELLHLCTSDTALGILAVRLSASLVPWLCCNFSLLFRAHVLSSWLSKGSSPQKREMLTTALGKQIRLREPGHVLWFAAVS